MSNVQDIREGDIYRWRWRDEGRHADSGPYRSYHCKSRIAVVHGGQLYDTFWSGFSYEHRVDPEKVILTYEGNPAEMTQIQPYNVPYYRREDIVDLRHSNNSGAPVYLRAGATRNAEVMLAEIAYRRDRAEAEIRSHQHTIERLDEAKALTESGKLDEVWL